MQVSKAQIHSRPTPNRPATLKSSSTMRPQSSRVVNKDLSKTMPIVEVNQIEEEEELHRLKEEKAIPGIKDDSSITNVVDNLEHPINIEISNGGNDDRTISILIKAFENESISSNKFRNTSWIINQLCEKIRLQLKEGVKNSLTHMNPVVYRDITFRKFTSTTFITLEGLHSGLNKIFDVNIPPSLVRELFSKLDVEKEGKVSKASFVSNILNEPNPLIKNILEKMNEKPSVKVDETLTLTNGANDKELNYLIKSFEGKINGRLRSSKDHYRNVLKFINGNSTNISPSMFRLVVQNIGLALNDSQVLQLFAFFDDSKKGLLNLNHILEKLANYGNHTGKESIIESIGKSDSLTEMMKHSNSRTGQHEFIIEKKEIALKYAREKIVQMIRRDKDRLNRVRHLLFNNVKLVDADILIEAFAKLHVNIEEKTACEIIKELNIKCLEPYPVWDFLISFLDDLPSIHEDSWVDKSEIAALEKIKKRKENGTNQFNEYHSDALDRIYKDTILPSQVVNDNPKFEGNGSRLLFASGSSLENISLIESGGEVIGDSSLEGSGFNTKSNFEQHEVMVAPPKSSSDAIWKYKVSKNKTQPLDLSSLLDVLFTGLNALTSSTDKAKEILMKEFQKYDVKRDQSISESKAVECLNYFNIEISNNVLSELRRYYKTADNKISYPLFIDDVISGTISNLFKVKSNLEDSNDTIEKYFNSSTTEEEEEGEEGDGNNVGNEIDNSDQVSRLRIDQHDIYVKSTNSKSASTSMEASWNNPPTSTGLANEGIIDMNTQLPIRPNTAINSKSTILFNELDDQIPVRRPQSAVTQSLRKKYNVEYLRDAIKQSEQEAKILNKRPESNTEPQRPKSAKYFPTNLAMDIYNFKQLKRPFIKRRKSISKPRDSWINDGKQSYHSSVIDAMEKNSNKDNLNVRVSYERKEKDLLSKRDSTSSASNNTYAGTNRQVKMIEHSRNSFNDKIDTSKDVHKRTKSIQFNLRKIS